jgi:hypothetical protein
VKEEFLVEIEAVAQGALKRKRRAVSNRHHGRAG